MSATVFGHHALTALNDIDSQINRLLKILEIQDSDALRIAGCGFMWPETGGFNPAASLNAQIGHFISPEFRTRILSKVDSRNVPASTGGAYDLTTRVCNDSAITSEVGGNYKFEDESELCFRVLQSINKEINGIVCNLRQYPGNLFYVADSVVILSWHTGIPGWCLHARQLDRCLYDRGWRVFSPG